MTEKEKAQRIYDYAVQLHGPDKAKEEALKSAKATYALAPYENNGTKSRTYWENVIEYLKNK